MFRLVPVALLLAGCTESACPEGSFQSAGGDCVEGDVETAAWEDGVVDGIQTRECVLREVDGTLDLQQGCAFGGCIGDTYQELLDTWGVGADCNDFSYTVDGETRERVGCDWENGLGMHFDAQDARPDLSDAGDVFTVESPFRGSTTGGLGIGVSLGCFAQQFGQPAEMDFDASENPDVPYRIVFRTDEFHAILYDGWILDDGNRDGIIDYLHIFAVD